MIPLPVKRILQLCVIFLLGGSTFTRIRLEGYQQSKCGQQIEVNNVKRFFDIATDFLLQLCFHHLNSAAPKI